MKISKVTFERVGVPASGQPDRISPPLHSAHRASDLADELLGNWWVSHHELHSPVRAPLALTKWQAVCALGPSKLVARMLWPADTQKINGLT
jgi:hypothetical protein